MKDLSIKEFSTIYDGLPGELKAAVNSDELNSALTTVLKNNHVSDSKAIEFRRVVAAVILGIIHPEDIEQESSGLVHMDPRAIKVIADGIRSRVLTRIAGDLNKAHGFHLQIQQLAENNHVVPSELPVPQINSPEDNSAIIPKKQTPLAPPQAASPQSQATQQNPLILHEHSETSATTPTNDQLGGNLVHPSFYVQPGGNASTDETPRAHLEIGSVENDDQAVRVNKENARVVHYSAPEAAADPFSTTPSVPQTKPAIDKKDVPQNNVVNLKDLPQ